MSNNQNYRDLKGNVSSLESTIDGADYVELSNVDSFISSLQSEINDVVSEVDCLEEDIDELEEWRSLDRDIDDVRQLIEDVEGVEARELELKLTHEKLEAMTLRFIQLGRALHEVDTIVTDELSGIE